MSLSSKADKSIAKAESEKARHKKKNCTPTDNYGDRYVTGMEKLRTQGKGDKNRDVPGWYSDEVTKTLEKIFGKKGKKKKKKVKTEHDE